MFEVLLGAMPLSKQMLIYLSSPALLGHYNVDYENNTTSQLFQRVVVHAF